MQLWNVGRIAKTGGPVQQPRIDPVSAGMRGNWNREFGLSRRTTTQPTATRPDVTYTHPPRNIDATPPQASNTKNNYLLFTLFVTISIVAVIV